MQAWLGVACDNVSEVGYFGDEPTERRAGRGARREKMKKKGSQKAHVLQPNGRSFLPSQPV